MPYIVIKNWKLKIVRKKRVVRRVSRGMIKHSKIEEKKLRMLAKEIAIEKTQQFNNYYNFKYGKIFIKNQRTRWGSCSSRKNLNFNYRIALLPTELQDYLIVHELCHLQQMNHGPNFWNLVAEQIPNPRILDKQLKTFSFK